MSVPLLTEHPVGIACIAIADVPIPDPVVVAGTDGKFVLINPAAEEVFSISDAFERGTPVAGRLPRGLDEMLLGSETDHGDIRLGSPEPCHYTISASAVRAADDRLIGRVLVLHDVTKLSG